MNANWKTALLSTATVLALAGCSTQKNTTTDTAKTPAAVDGAVVPAAAPNDADAKRSAVLAAAEPFEVLTEQAPGATPAKLKELVATARQAASGVSASLAATGRAGLDNHLAAIAGAQAKDDRAGIALAAIEGYRTLVESASDTRSVPRAVNLLDYAGFRYQANLSAKPIRWADATAAVDFAKGQWAGIERRITDTGLKNQFAASVTAMGDAAGRKDAAAAKKAADTQLALVDKLETFFSKKP